MIAAHQELVDERVDRDRVFSREVLHGTRQERLREVKARNPKDRRRSSLKPKQCTPI